MFVRFSLSYKYGDELEFLKQVFFIGYAITIETDSINNKNASFCFVSIETPYLIIGFLLKTPARPIKWLILTMGRLQNVHLSFTGLKCKFTHHQLTKFQNKSYVHLCFGFVFIRFNFVACKVSKILLVGDTVRARKNYILNFWTNFFSDECFLVFPGHFFIIMDSNKKIESDEHTLVQEYYLCVRSTSSLTPPLSSANSLLISVGRGCVCCVYTDVCGGRGKRGAEWLGLR